MGIMNTFPHDSRSMFRYAVYFCVSAHKIILRAPREIVDDSSEKVMLCIVIYGAKDNKLRFIY